MYIIMTCNRVVGLECTHEGSSEMTLLGEVVIEWRRRTDRNSHEGEKGAYIGHGENMKGKGCDK